ncbi:sugar transferase [Salinibacillus xinjiangensis]|uniref:Sugar transferase n=1 Tax=Salinibacillus xinjiangensis TaxID=1229268 RepID=A0A6G1X2F9_9BACI|nr:sugar transferase [Salinibacillus xinjiangensis]MRG85075.1 sugar transferase [Salinibacillus xinjiangensis]
MPSLDTNYNKTINQSYEYQQVQETPDLSNIYFFVKRFIDILGALFGLIILFPVLLIISVFYLFGDNKGTVFFKQNRFGKDGKKFSIYKFRSMVVNAEEKLKSNPMLYEKYIRNNYKLEPGEDPRITKFGQFLRKTSLDELPQLFNVLKGDMSLVGPRPVVEDELVEYGNRRSTFLAVKPGVTGYWQVSGRSEVGYPERVDIELYYVFNQSLKLDLKIILKTFLIVVTKKGAY